MENLTEIKIDELLNENSKLREENVSLKSIVEMFENFESYARNEMIETKSYITAKDKILEFILQEKSETQETLNAMVETQELARKEILQKNNTLQKILDITKEITQIPQREDLLSKILNEVLLLVSAEHGALFFMEDGNKLKPKILLNLKREYLHSVEFKHNKKIIKECIRTSKIIHHKYKEEGSRHKKSFICAPLIGKKLLGIIYLNIHSEMKIFKFRDLEAIEIFCVQAAIAIENMYLYKNLEKEVKKRTQELQNSYNRIEKLYKEIEVDLKMARKIQTSILPRINKRFNNLLFDIVFLPTAYIGGDIYDIYIKDESSIRIFLADATGHGIQAALVTMLILGVYNRLKETASRVDELAKSLNKEFFIKFQQLTVMFSFVLLDIDLKKEKLYFVSGGHPDQLFIQNKQIYELQRTGRIIGLLEDCTYRTTILDFKPGDKLFLFTDGIFEEFNDEDEIFGEEKLKEIIEKYIDEPYMLIMSYVMKELYEFTGSVGITDDLTMLSVEFSKE